MVTLQKTIFCLIFLASLFQLHKSQYSTSFCNGKIIDDDSFLTQREIDQICEAIEYDGLYAVYIKNFISLNKNSDLLIFAESQFTIRCSKWTGFCQDGVMFFLFMANKIIEITAGSFSKNTLRIPQRALIIESVANKLKNREYSSAIESMINQSRNILRSAPKNQINGGMNSNTNKPSQGSTTVIIAPNQSANTRPAPSHSSGMGGFTLFLLIVCPLCSVAGIIYFICFRKTENDNSEPLYSNQSNIPLQERNYSNNIQQPYQLSINEHFNLLLRLLNEIRASPTRSKFIDYCLICMKPFPLDNLNPPSVHNNFTSNPDNVRFTCGHLYHNHCLSQKSINQCYCCGNNPMAFQRTPNFAENRQEINEANLSYFVEKLNNLYPREVVEEYSRNYPEHRCQMENSFGMSFATVFGISAIAGLTTAALLSSGYGHNYGYGGYGNEMVQQNQINNININNYNGNDAGNNYQPNNGFGAPSNQPDTAIGGWGDDD